jgi:phenylalanine-4-hydroxylase
MARTIGEVGEQYLIEQNWNVYSAEDHEVWEILYERRMKTLQDTGSRMFLDGARTIGLDPDQVPVLQEVNDVLQTLTGWNAAPVNGFLPAREFFLSLAGRRFPTTVIVRSKEQLNYLPEPDIFHDVFGHVPLHAEPVFTDFLQRFGKVASRVKTEDETAQMARLFWFTIKFGLTREDGEIKVYGSGLISSSSDAANALGPNCDRRPFSLDAVIEQPFEIDRLQDILFVVESFDQLFAAADEMERRLAS